MRDEAQSNTVWQARVRALLKQGYGSEDIAVLTGAPLKDVQFEIQILRQSGDLAAMFGSAA